MRHKVFEKLIENHRSKLYKLTSEKGLNFNHPEVIKKSQELDHLIHVHNSLLLNKEVCVKSALAKIYKFDE